MKLRASLGASVLLVLWSSVVCAQADRYAGQVLAQTEPVDRAQLAFVLELADVVLADNPRVGALPVVLPERKLAELRAAGVRYTVVQRDLDRAFAAERERLAQQRTVYAADPALFLQDFRSGAEIDAHLETLAALAPERVTIIDVGSSLEGRPIRGLRIAQDERERPSYVLIGTQHAREWVATMVTVCLADAFIRRYDGEPRIKRIQERLALVVVPVVNPDGYEYSRTIDRLWRKNRRPGGGVDLNRNWDQGWSSARGPSQSNDLYPGPEAFSEPESTAVAELLRSLPKVAAFLDIHTDGQMVVHPLAYTSTPAPNGVEILQWAKRMSEAMTSVNDVYHHIERAGLTNPTGGLAQDYATIEYGVVGLTMELRHGTSSSGFGDRPSNIAPTCDEALAGFLSVAVPLAEATPALPAMEPDAGVPDPPTDAGAGAAGSPTHVDAGAMLPSSGAGGIGGAGGAMQTTGGDGGMSAPPMSGSGGVPEMPVTGGAAAPAAPGIAGQQASPEPALHDSGDGGGCSLRASDRGLSATGPALAWLALTVLAARRRRESARRSPRAEGAGRSPSTRPRDRTPRA